MLSALFAPLAMVLAGFVTPDIPERGDPGEPRGPGDPGEPRGLGVFESPLNGLATVDNGKVPAKPPAIPDIESSGDFKVSSPPTGDVIGGSFGPDPTPRFEGSFCNGKVKPDTGGG